MKTINLKSTRVLNRKDLRKIRGGGAIAPPGTPSGGIPGSYKCCYTETNICSPCVDCTSFCICGSDANLVQC